MPTRYQRHSEADPYSFLMGGVGMRRGRREPDQLQVDDTLNCWRVESIRPGKRLRLKSEMELPGRAWLDFEVEPDGEGARLVQTGSFDPAGLWGLIYWYGIWPLHQLEWGKWGSVCKC